MKHWTIGKRITAATGLLCALLTLVGAIAWYSLGGLGRQGVALRDDVMPGLISSSRFYSLLAKGFIRLQLYVATTDKAMLGRAG